MKTKTITLAGTAMAAIFAAGFVLSAQAATSAKDNAREKQITRQLNENQMQNPGVVNGKRAGAANTQVSQNNTGAEDNGAANTGYTGGANAEDKGAMDQDENNPQNTGYSGESEDKNNSGAEDMRENGNGQMHERAQTNGASLSTGISLTDVPNARSEFQSATIETRNGEEIGTVQSVDLNSDGTARAVRADVDGRQVSIDSNDLVYVKQNKALVTDLTKPEIENLPPASKSY